GPGTEQVRPRQLHAECPGHLLVDAGDGVRRRADVPDRRRGWVALLEEEARAGALVPVDSARRDSAALHRRHGGLGPHPDWPPAPGPARPAEEQRRELAEP